MVKPIYTIAAAVIITALVVGGVAYFVMQPPPSANVVEIYHWWTSGGEKAAIDALVKVFNASYPTVGVIQTPVAGGAGYVMKALMKSLVLAGEAPDAFQMHAGYEGKPYYDAGYLDQITSLWTSQGWASVIPPVVQAMCKFGNDYYAVPVNIHRVNVLWYNKPLLTGNHIDPATLTNWTAFFNACDALKANATLQAAGVTPVALGDSGPWTVAHVFEQIMASEGIGFYQDWVNGKITSATNTTLVHALTILNKTLTYVNPDHAALTWDQATARLITNKSVFNIMGDWANGEFLKAGKTYGTFYGTLPSPGTAGMYGLCIDCFQHPKGVKHPDNSLKWLTVVGSKAGQDAFNPLKGSISARNDSDTTKYGPYQQGAIANFKSATHMFPSVTHGSGAPEAFSGKLGDIMSSFVTSHAISACASALTAATVAAQADYTTVWHL